LGDFYGIWFKAIHGLNADGSILAKTIKIGMEKELKEKYLENTTFLAGMCILLYIQNVYLMASCTILL